MANPHNGEHQAADTETARHIEALLDKKGISILALSEQSGIAYKTLHRSIKSDRSLNLKEVAKIADALQVKPFEFLPATFTQAA